jgi:hypothetical protein
MAWFEVSLHCQLNLLVNWSNITTVASPCWHRPWAGAVSKYPLFAAPQAPPSIAVVFMEAEHLAVVPPLVPKHDQLILPSRLVLDSVPLAQRFLIINSWELVETPCPAPHLPSVAWLLNGAEQVTMSWLDTLQYQEYLPFDSKICSDSNPIEQRFSVGLLAVGLLLALPQVAVNTEALAAEHLGEDNVP